MTKDIRIDRRKLIAAAAAAAAASSAGYRSGAAQDAATVRYMLWDANQLPAYQACADLFTEANPNITIEIEQLGWDDYWTAVQTGMISGTAPDVFTNHLAKFPEFAERGQLVDIQPMVEEEGLDLSIYQGELTEVWQRDGQRYGLPKDWDTVAMVYNKAMLDAAGVDVAELNELTWNPEDGGTFAELVAKLTLDANGNNALSDDFDSGNIEQYGLSMTLGDAYGQTGWSFFAGSTGWHFLDAPWTPPFHFDDERFINSFQQLADMQNVSNTAMRDEELVGTFSEQLFSAGTCALIFHGSWMITWLDDNVTFDWGFARLPIGPEGRKCMINGLADSIWTGSEVQDAAWEWVKFLASTEAQELVGSYGAVFPAIFSGAEAAQAAYEERGLDVSPFLDQAAEEGGTFLFPIADKASEYVAIVQPALQEVAMGLGSAADIIPFMNEEVNDLY